MEGVSVSDGAADLSAVRQALDDNYVFYHNLSATGESRQLEGRARAIGYFTQTVGRAERQKRVLKDNQTFIRFNIEDIDIAALQGDMQELNINHTASSNYLYVSENDITRMSQLGRDVDNAMNTGVLNLSENGMSYNGNTTFLNDIMGGGQLSDTDIEHSVWTEEADKAREAVSAMQDRSMIKEEHNQYRWTALSFEKNKELQSHIPEIRQLFNDSGISAHAYELSAKSLAIRAGGASGNGDLLIFPIRIAHFRLNTCYMAKALAY